MVLNRPLVSVILPVRNAERYVEAAAQSILHQTFDDFELLILDDGSTDRTPEIVETFATTDKRIRVIRSQQRGLVDTLNAGTEAAHGEFVARMDADDIAAPARLAAQVAALESDPELGLVGATVVVVAEDLRYLWTASYPQRDAAIRKALKSGNAFAHPVVMMRKTAFERTGGYRAELLHAEDYDLWLRIADTSRLANLPQTLLRYRAHPEQVSTLQTEQQIISVVAAQFCADARAAGQREPISLGQAVKLQDLQVLTRDPATLPNRLISAGTAAAMQMIRIGQPSRAMTLLGWVESVSPGPLSKPTMARLLLARAAASWTQRHRRRALREGVLACAADPYTTTHTALAAARSIAGVRRTV